MDLLTLGAVIALSHWAKRLSRRPGAPPYLARVWLVLAAFWALELAGFVGTIATLVHEFHAVDSVAPEKKAKTLADGISRAMDFTAIGAGFMFLALAVTTAILLRWHRRLPRESPATPG
ncbi:MAG TPA: MotA/TolQ/ExbB proton channel family protein [Polyangiaceae bacterium]